MDLFYQREVPRPDFDGGLRRFCFLTTFPFRYKIHLVKSCSTNSYWFLDHHRNDFIKSLFYTNKFKKNFAFTDFFGSSMFVVIFFSMLCMYSYSLVYCT